MQKMIALVYWIMVRVTSIPGAEQWGRWVRNKVAPDEIARYSTGLRLRRVEEAWMADAAIALKRESAPILNRGGARIFSKRSARRGATSR